jgi:hypothetical protein
MKIYKCALLLLALFIFPTSGFCFKISNEDIYKELLHNEQEDRERYAKVMAAIKHNDDVVEYYAITNDCNCGFYLEHMTDLGKIQIGKIINPNWADIGFGQCMAMQTILLSGDNEFRRKIYSMYFKTVMNAAKAWTHIRSTGNDLDYLESRSVAAGNKPGEISRLGAKIEEWGKKDKK